jgi:peptidoglycan/LPS O-acetylase OafA/YrhL
VVLATIKTYRASLWEKLQQRTNMASLAGLVITAASLAIFQDRAGWLATVFGYPLLSLGFACLVIAGAGTRGWLAAINLPGARWIATISYSLYLSHKAVMHLLKDNLAPFLDGHGYLAFGLYALAITLTAALLQYTVERPFLRLRERFFTRPQRSLADVRSAAA